MAKILITGGAGFIGSNLVDHFLAIGHEVVCLDNLSTGFEKNIQHNYSNKNFIFIKGDICDMEICKKAISNCSYVLHQAALGSVPRSISNPVLTNHVNIVGFLNMIVAARDAGIDRFVYAASSSTYGDSEKLPKIEEEIGKPLSPYAVTKYVNELYAEVFAKTYEMQCIGLRYFNVFGQRQDPNGAYAAVIPLWTKMLINHQSPIINGNEMYSRDFTFINNVIKANEKALFISKDELQKGQKNYYMNLSKNKINFKLFDNNKNSFSEILNIACGGNITLLQLFINLRKNLAIYDKDIANIKHVCGPSRIGDIPHSQASILKAQTIIGYVPEYDVKQGLAEAAGWYFHNLKN